MGGGVGGAVPPALGWAEGGVPWTRACPGCETRACAAAACHRARWDVCPSQPAPRAGQRASLRQTDRQTDVAPPPTAAAAGAARCPRGAWNGRLNETAGCVRVSPGSPPTTLRRPGTRPPVPTELRQPPAAALRPRPGRRRFPGFTVSPTLPASQGLLASPGGFLCDRLGFPTRRIPSPVGEHEFYSLLPSVCAFRASFELHSAGRNLPSVPDAWTSSPWPRPGVGGRVLVCTATRDTPRAPRGCRSLAEDLASRSLPAESFESE